MLHPDDYLPPERLWLAPCPKCLNRAEFRDEGEYHYYVVCEYNCVRQVGTYGAKAAAAENWNNYRKMADAIDSILGDAVRRLAKLREAQMPPTSTRAK